MDRWLAAGEGRRLARENAIQAVRISFPLWVSRNLYSRPLWTIGKLKEQAGLPVPTVTRAIASLERLGVVRETTGRRRGRVYAYDACLQVLSEGTEPL